MNTTTTPSGTSIFATIKTEISEKQIKDILVNAFEGGSGYWCQHQGYVFPEGITYADFQDNRDKGGSLGKFCDPNNYYHPIQLIPLVPGCAVKLFDVTGESDNKTQQWDAASEPDIRKEKGNRYLLTREKLIAGLQKMHDLKHGEGGHHWHNWMKENDDTITGDVYLQCCIFGEIIYS
jgi:hypothetical protein